VGERIGSLLAAAGPLPTHLQPLPPRTPPSHAAKSNGGSNVGSPSLTPVNGDRTPHQYGSGGNGRVGMSSAARVEGVSVRVELRTTSSSANGAVETAANGSSEGTSSDAPVRVQLVLGSWVEMRRRQLLRELATPPPSLRFLETRSVLELTMGDIASLHEEYRWLSHALRPAARTSSQIG